MKLRIVALVLAMTLASCTTIGISHTQPPKPAHKAEPVKPTPAPAPAPVVKNGDITKADKDHIKDLLDQAIKKADCSDPASKDDPSCAN